MKAAFDQGLHCFTVYNLTVRYSVRRISISDTISDAIIHLQVGGKDRTDQNVVFSIVKCVCVRVCVCFNQLSRSRNKFAHIQSEVRAPIFGSRFAFASFSGSMFN